ncbi:MAG TPA: ThiF family adenylyltransferase [Anaeromyxobacteraceae bacterium]|nr:ThiF family adenylyltransferase [Anaeromyxobacteraceae bacterium]
MMSLSDAEVARYARQLILPAMGEAGQARLKAARVRVVGGGLMGGPAVLYLAAAGVGTIWVDDPDPVGAEDAAAWLYLPEHQGRARGAAAAEAARAANALVTADILRPGARPTALLICPDRQDVARAVAEEARLLGLSHVVAEADGDGGSVTVVPPGAPCYACAFRAGHGAPPRPAGAAAVGALAALELVLHLAGASQEPRGRRTDLVRGQPVTRATSRIPGCACGAGGAAP